MEEFIRQLLAQMGRQPDQTFGAEDAARLDSDLADLLTQQDPQALADVLPDFPQNSPAHDPYWKLVSMLGYKVPSAIDQARQQAGLDAKYNADGSPVTEEQLLEREQVFADILPEVRHRIAERALTEANQRLYTGRALMRLRAEELRGQRNAQNEQRRRMRQAAREAAIGEQERNLTLRDARLARQARDMAHYVMSQAADAGRKGRRGITALLLRGQRMANQAGRDVRDEFGRRREALIEGDLRGRGERRAREDAEIRRSRQPMGPPSYQEGGMTYDYGVAPEIAPWAAGIAGQAQQYGQMFPYGTPAQQAAWQGMQTYGMGQGPQAMRDAYQTMTGGTQGFIDPQVALQRPMIEEQEARQLQGVGSQAAQAGAFGGGRHGLAEQAVRQGTRQQIENLGARAYADAFGRQMQMAGGLASLGGQQQRQQMERLGLLGQAAQQQYMMPYQNLQTQASIMGMLPYRGQTQAMPTQGQGFFGSVLPTFLEGLGAYREYQAGERNRKGAR